MFGGKFGCGWAGKYCPPPPRWLSTPLNPAIDRYPKVFLRYVQVLKCMLGPAPALTPQVGLRKAGNWPVLVGGHMTGWEVRPSGWDDRLIMSKSVEICCRNHWEKGEG